MSDGNNDVPKDGKTGGRKYGREYTTRGKAEWKESMNRTAMKCAVEAGVSDKIARGVLFLGWPISSNPRIRAYQWGIKMRVIKKPAQVGEIPKLIREAEKRDDAFRVAEADAEDRSATAAGPPGANAKAQSEEADAFDALLARLQASEKKMDAGLKSLQGDIVQEEREQRARLLATAEGNGQ